jgi:protein-S-isoprenylcysteine O-methyltransferase Ste14
MKLNAMRGSSGTFWAELITTVYFCFFLHFNWTRIAEVWDLYDMPLFILAVLYPAKIGLMHWLEQQGGEPWDFGHSKKLVTTGPYRFTRNPVYTMVLVQLICWLIAVVATMTQGNVWPDKMAHPIAWIIGAAMSLAWFYVYADCFAIPREERTLGADHPKEFAAYCRRVGRWGALRRSRPGLAPAWDAAN